MSHKLVGIATKIVIMTVIISVVLLIIGIGIVVFIHACVVGRVFRRGRFRTEATPPGHHGRRVGLSLDDLEKLPCYDFKVGLEEIKAGNGRPVDCVVCLESFQVGERCRLLPACRHTFHAQCVDSWLLKSPLCPICRTSAGGDDGNSAGDRLESTGG